MLFIYILHAILNEWKIFFEYWDCSSRLLGMRQARQFSFRKGLRILFFLSKPFFGWCSFPSESPKKIYNTGPFWCQSWNSVHPSQIKEHDNSIWLLIIKLNEIFWSTIWIHSWSCLFYDSSRLSVSQHTRTSKNLLGQGGENFNSDILTVRAKSTIFYLLAGAILSRASVAQR